MLLAVLGHVLPLVWQYPTHASCCARSCSAPVVAVSHTCLLLCLVMFCPWCDSIPHMLLTVLGHVLPLVWQYPTHASCCAWSCSAPGMTVSHTFSFGAVFTNTTFLLAFLRGSYRTTSVSSFLSADFSIVQKCRFLMLQHVVYKVNDGSVMNLCPC